MLRSQSFPPFFDSVFNGFNGAETNCRIARILGILLMNSCNTDIYIYIFSNYYNLQSVHFDLSFFIFVCYFALVLLFYYTVQRSFSSYEIKFKRVLI